MRKYLYLIVMAASLLGCSESVSESQRYAAEQGRIAAQKVIDAPQGSMQRTAALLEIKSKAYQIRQLGDTLAAKAYMDAAIARLDSVGVIQKN